MIPKISNISFKGYDACPIKNLYVDSVGFKPFHHEMKEIANKEGVGLVEMNDSLKWMQDNKILLQRGNKEILLNNGVVSYNVLNYFNRRGIESKNQYGFVTGGNCFLGKNDKGERWVMAGAKQSFIIDSKEDLIADAYEVDKKNIILIPRQDYHLDMFLRPVGYPYVLVDDPELDIKNLRELNSDSPVIKKTIEYLEALINSKSKPQCKDTIKALKDAGFVPIRIAGNYLKGINFMNAIVNRHKDGTMTYITNSSLSENNKDFSKLQEIFEAELKAKVPDIKKVYFIKGKQENSLCDNEMMSHLEWQGGGIHCLCLEEPDFEAWA